MKKTLTILAVLAFAFAGLQLAIAQQNDWDAPQVGQGRGQGQQGQQGQRGQGQQGQGRWQDDQDQRGGGMGQQNGRGQGMGQGMGGPGMGQGMMGQGMMGRGMGRVSEEELTTFLTENEPEMARNLNRLRQQDPEAYRQKIQSLQAVYGRVIMQNQRDPEGAKLEMKKIKLTLEINTMLEGKDSISSEDKRLVNNKVSEIFDIVIQQEQQRIEQWQDMAGSWGAQTATDQDDSATDQRNQAARDQQRSQTERDQQRGQADRDQQQQRGYGAGQRGWGADERGTRMQENLRERNKQIELWKKNKDTIVRQRTEQLVNKVEQFPW